MGLLNKIKNRLKKREYKIIDGLLCISEHGSHFLPLLDHVCKEHPEDWAKAKAFDEELNHVK